MKPKILLHTCCAPCFTGSYEQLKDDYDSSVYWFNPNIEPVGEHSKRLEVLLFYIKTLDKKIPIFYDYDYEMENKRWNEFIAGLETEPEGGKRCKKCFLYRMSRTSEMAKKREMSFATTLTISPYKSSETINLIGENLSKKYDTPYLMSNFKENKGFQRSVDLSKKMGLYRQKYCGCRFSINK